MDRREQGSPMTLTERLHFLHRAWRYRLRSEKFGVRFLLSRDLRGTTVLDIGANRGIYSYWMHKKVGAEGRVIAFEPQPELATELYGLRSAFGLGRLVIETCALSSASGRRVFTRPVRHWGGGGFDVRPEGEAERFEVSVTTLDEYFETRAGRPVGFIKCDVEGHERDVFLGGERLLRADRPDLLFECFTESSDCPTFRLLESFGYCGFCFFGDGLAPIDRYDDLQGRLHPKARHNFVFVPRERAAAAVVWPRRRAA
ncbi:MAG: FkbM family methyltransferase [Planctomycetota bacterium]|nr:MAG: FkbM family methyltransferase [Planctomycetota bacterium]